MFSSFSPQVQQASSVDRRTSSNLFGPESDKFSSDLSETQSDFVSSRRHWDLDPPRPNFSYLESEEDSSRSMINIRDAGMQRGPTAKELMMSHIAHVKSANGPGQPYQSSKSTMSSSPGRMRWGEMSSSNNNKAWPTSTTDAYGYRISTSPARQDMSFTVSATPAMVDMTPPPLAPRTTSRVFSTPPSQNALSKIQSVTSTTTTPSSAFRRKTMDRSSLSKKYLENGNSQPKTVWSPQTLATSSAPRRSNSNLFAAVQNAAREQGSYRRQSERKQRNLRFSATVRSLDPDSESSDEPITPSRSRPTTRKVATPVKRGKSSLAPTTKRSYEKKTAGLHKSKSFRHLRADENSYTPSSALRSRSQSPNKIALGFTNRENAESTSNLIGGRDKGYQRRRDSEMSYMSRSVSRGPGPRDPEMRKSTDALNKLMASKNKLHQSSDNLRKSTDNLTLIQNQPETTSYGANRSRTRSSSNLRAGQLEPFTTFDADSRLRSAGSSTSLAHSRLLARSMTNLENGLATEGSSAAPGRRLANTIQMMKKASNSDLTQPEQYDDGSNQGALKIRGAVQKKVDRYKPRNRALSGRPQTSEESDSNNSDGYPLGSTGANNGLGIKLSSNRSTTNSSEFSPASSTRSSILGGALGSGSLSANRRLFENQKAGVLSTPRRSGNYLSQKLSDATAAHRTMEGPDLGSDESPRSSLNSLDFNGMVESSIVGRNPIVRHVQDCLEQLRINVDKSIQAKKLVEDDTTIPSDQKKIILGEIDKSIDTAIEKLAPKRSEEDNGNDYAPMKGQIYGVLKENLTSRQ